MKNAKHGQEIDMAGRKPQLNWTKSRSQYTTTVDGAFHLLGTDKEEAEQQFRWLLNKHDLGEPVDTNPASPMLPTHGWSMCRRITASTMTAW